jgi:hypothetical protein
MDAAARERARWMGSCERACVTAEERAGQGRESGRKRAWQGGGVGVRGMVAQRRARQAVARRPEGAQACGDGGCGAQGAAHRARACAQKAQTRKNTQRILSLAASRTAQLRTPRAARCVRTVGGERSVKQVKGRRSHDADQKRAQRAAPRHLQRAAAHAAHTRTLRASPSEACACMHALHTQGKQAHAARRGAHRARVVFSCLGERASAMSKMMRSSRKSESAKVAAKRASAGASRAPASRAHRRASAKAHPPAKSAASDAMHSSASDSSIAAARGHQARGGSRRMRRRREERMEKTE